MAAKRAALIERLVELGRDRAVVEREVSRLPEDVLDRCLSHYGVGGGLVW